MLILKSFFVKYSRRVSQMQPFSLPVLLKQRLSPCDQLLFSCWEFLSSLPENMRSLAFRWTWQRQRISHSLGQRRYPWNEGWSLSKNNPSFLESKYLCSLWVQAYQVCSELVNLRLPGSKVIQQRIKAKLVVLFLFWNSTKIQEVLISRLWNLLCVACLVVITHIAAVSNWNCNLTTRAATIHKIRCGEYKVCMAQVFGTAGIEC